MFLVIYRAVTRGCGIRRVSAYGRRASGCSEHVPTSWVVVLVGGYDIVCSTVVLEQYAPLTQSDVGTLPALRPGAK